MKNSEEEKKINKLKKQKVNSDKIQGGGVGPIHVVLSKETSNSLPSEHEGDFRPETKKKILGRSRKGF